MQNAKGKITGQPSTAKETAFLPKSLLPRLRQSEKKLQTEQKTTTESPHEVSSLM